MQCFWKDGVKSENGLYPMRFQTWSSTNKHVFSAFFGLKTSIPVWHFRLGHPSFVTVNRVIKAHNLPISNISFNKDQVCDSCLMGKSKQLPFLPSNRLSTTIFELVHTDLWTSPIPSISGCKYYLIFVDDFSRYTWMYPLHNKSDTYTHFVKFKVLVETQFNCKLKQLQSDGGGEYTSTIFQNFLSQNGIVHRKSCPYTSQQNGLAERKLRHILETGLTLLAHSGLSNKYWVDAFLTAVYIINRLPTHVLGYSSPHEKLFQKPPDYTLLRVFGCKCFPLLRPYTSHKLEYRSKACIFLGYSHAGYRCLDPVTNRVFLSRHVVFDEQSFPAKDHARLHLPSKVNASSDVPFQLPVSIYSPASVTTLIAPSPNPEPPRTTDEHFIPPSNAARNSSPTAPACASFSLPHNSAEPTLRVPHHAASLPPTPTCASPNCTTSPAPTSASSPLPHIPTIITSSPLATPHSSTLSPVLPPPPVFHCYVPLKSVSQT